MKVQCLNASSRKTRKLIKTVFAELMQEKKKLSKIKVTELVKRADITRSTFYTHYDDIYEVAKDYELETIELLTCDDKILYTNEDILRLERTSPSAPGVYRSWMTEDCAVGLSVV